jgi:hypothetical protein
MNKKEAPHEPKSKQYLEDTEERNPFEYLALLIEE